MSGASPLELYRGALAGELGLGPDRIALFWKGRVALWAILRALGVRPGDDVVLPAFTCVAVPNAIIQLGARPVYADIDPATYNVDVDSVEARITARTSVLLAQNTFGLAPDLDRIGEIGRARGIHVVEDCAHGFGGTYRSRPNGTTAAASFFSSQWSKPFSTGIGGFTATPDGALAAELTRIEGELARPSAREALTLRLLLLARRHLIRPAIYWPAVRLYRSLSRRNLVVGSSRGGELEEPVIPREDLKTLSEVQAREGLARVGQVPGAIAHRRRIAGVYAAALDELGIPPVVAPDHAEHTYLRFPLQTRDRDAFMRAAMSERLEIGDWFISPVHPVTNGLSTWLYDWGSNPVAERICAGIVNLPTGEDVDDRRVERVVDLVHRHRGLLGEPAG
jgi:perosamine synthetase